MSEPSAKKDKKGVLFNPLHQLTPDKLGFSYKKPHQVPARTGNSDQRLLFLLTMWFYIPGFLTSRPECICFLFSLLLRLREFDRVLSFLRFFVIFFLSLAILNINVTNSCAAVFSHVSVQNLDHLFVKRFWWNA